METTQKPQTTAADFFLQISVVVTLYASAVSFLAFIFNVIDTVLPDRQDYFFDPYSGGLRIAVSTLIVVFPLFIYLSRKLRQSMVETPSKREIWVRRWLTYFTLFISGIAISVDLITLINSFLGGEITSRFILKVVAVLIVAGAIFFYYIADLRGKFFENPSLSKTASWIVGVVVFVAVVSGFFLIGSPVSQRQLRDDAQRVNDLSSLQYQVLNHYQTTGTLPAQLGILNDSLSGYMVPNDPETGAAYEYAIKSVSTTSLAFDLCATFVKESAALGNRKETPAIYSHDYGFGGSSWQHSVGRTCFARIIDTTKYPLFPRK